MAMNDSVWDELDDADFEECIVKETEYLSQCPSLWKKSLTYQKTAVVQNNPNQFHKTSENHSSVNHKISNYNGSFNSLSKNFGLQETNSKPKKPNGTNHFSFDNSFPNAAKKASFYKPLELGASTSANKPITKSPQNKKENDAPDDLKELQEKLKKVQQERDALQEDNLVKQGEVINLRCNLKKKEAILDSERVDQCIALEAAEKRGKEKMTKSLTEIESKVASLEREIDRLQGVLLFKNNEVDELLAKCKDLEHRQSNPVRISQIVLEKSPSPKRRKISNFRSPTKTTSNFAKRFDFGEGKKASKDNQTQTESNESRRNKNILKTSSARGRSLGNRKAFYILSSQGLSTNHSSPKDNSSNNKSSLLAQMIFSEFSQSNSANSENNILTFAWENLEKLLKNTEMHRTSGNESSKAIISSDALPFISMLSLTRSSSEHTSQNVLSTLASVLRVLLEEANINFSAVSSTLVAISSLADQCSSIPSHLCNTLCESIRRCCDAKIKGDVIKNLFITLSTLCSFENFERIVCVNNSELCLLKRVCHLFPEFPSALSNKIWSPEISNPVMTFIAKLLHISESFVTKTDCSCSPMLLSTFLGYLFQSSKSASKDTEWFPIVTGIKLLHLWQTKDKYWWERAPHLHSYTALLSTVVRKSKYLKAKGILDQPTWELLYDLYDIEDSA